MSNDERHIVPRKARRIPVRFNVIMQGLAALGTRAKPAMPRGTTPFQVILRGAGLP